jgi:hypothetical protein
MLGMKKLLFIFSMFIATLILAINSTAQDNLISNSDFETQGAWKVNQCDPNGNFDVSFAITGVTPSDGSGKAVELAFASDGSSTAEVFVYQPVGIIPGHTYTFSAAMMDLSLALTDSWIEIAYVTTEPVDGAGIEEISAAKFGTWQACDGAGFDGLIETSCATYPTGLTTPFPYFHIPDTTSSDTIYFGIDVGTWGTTCNLDFSFDNLTLVDSAEVSGINLLHFDKPANLFSLYPNPSVNRIVNIDIFDKSYMNYNLLNGEGQVIISGYINGSASLDLGYLKSGIYLIQVLSDKQTETKKLILY